ncbi:MAG: hypothetical protein QOI41_2765, partial [Myxococcales bacterium]|nr:hypothetical protein [Myxococcales bacterium]
MRPAADAQVRRGVRAPQRSRLDMIQLEVAARRTSLARFADERAPLAVASFASNRSIAASITTARSPLGLRWRIKSHARSSFAFSSALAVSCTLYRASESGSMRDRGTLGVTGASTPA